ncbi:hypothetical protein EON63_13005 [archaeon]|nr:MAG: hypothetical protein EON63_13005 [archaeon]
MVCIWHGGGELSKKKLWRREMHTYTNIHTYEYLRTCTYTQTHNNVHTLPILILAGASIVLGGIVVVLIPTFFTSPSVTDAAAAAASPSSAEGNSELLWILVLVVSCVPMCLSSVYKEKVEIDVPSIRHTPYTIRHTPYTIHHRRWARRRSTSCI